MKKSKFKIGDEAYVKRFYLAPIKIISNSDKNGYYTAEVYGEDDLSIYRDDKIIVDTTPKEFPTMTKEYKIEIRSTIKNINKFDDIIEEVCTKINKEMVRKDYFITWESIKEYFNK